MSCVLIGVIGVMRANLTWGPGECSNGTFSLITGTQGFRKDPRGDSSWVIVGVSSSSWDGKCWTDRGKRESREASNSTACAWGQRHELRVPRAQCLRQWGRCTTWVRDSSRRARVPCWKVWTSFQGGWPGALGSKQEAHSLVDTACFPVSLIHYEKNKCTSNLLAPPNRILTCPGFHVSRPHSPYGSTGVIFPGEE